MNTSNKQNQPHIYNQWHVAGLCCGEKHFFDTVYFDNTLSINRLSRGAWLWCSCWAKLSTVRRGERLQKAEWWVGQLMGSWRMFLGSLFRTFIRGLLDSLLSDAITSCALVNFLFKSWKQKVDFIWKKLVTCFIVSLTQITFITGCFLWSIQTKD